MMKPDVLDVVRELVRSELGRKQSVNLETHLLEDLGLDSIELLTLAIALENHFEVCLEPGRDDELTRVGDVVTVIVEKLEHSGVNLS